MYSHGEAQDSLRRSLTEACHLVQAGLLNLEQLLIRDLGHGTCLSPPSVMGVPTPHVFLYGKTKCSAKVAKSLKNMRRF